jgi:hypothetical protein
MKKKLPIRAAVIEAELRAEKAIRAALEIYADRVVSEAQAHAPVRKVFKVQGGRKRTKATTGKLSYLDVGMQGKGSRILVNRQDRPRGREILLGRVTHRSGRRAADPGVFKSKNNLATRFLTQTGTAAARSGRGSRPVYSQGYALNATYSPLLTSRARYNLARGIGVHEVGGGSFSTAPAGSLILGGALRDSIHAEDVTATDNGWEVSVTASVRYARYVEYGTYKDHAQPFIRPAIHNTKRYLPAILKQELKKAGLNNTRLG